MNRYTRIVIGLICICMPYFSMAQEMELDENCVVSILNRTIQVGADGQWALPNVPSFMGQVRARANCLVDGLTISGQSDFFSVGTSGVSQAGDVSFVDLTPIPTSLSFVITDNLVLNSTNPIQLDVIASYSDGSTSEALIPGSGVNYNSSNPSIASVNADGLVIPATSGNVLITARLEGALAIKPLLISLSGDIDGDGLPDDFELAQGLDPNDPIDSMEDQDRDGLSALEEYGIGTDINLSDTDGDTVLDGEELVAGEDGFITSPLLFDSDGDYVSDGLEIATGSDPNDAGSLNITSALDSIAIEQDDFEIVFNGVQTEVSAQISVLGHLIDGSQLELTSTTIGTQYASSDLSVVSFGLTSGEVFAGIDGVSTLTASNSGFSDSVEISVSTFDPIALASLNIPGTANELEVEGNYLYIAAGAAGLQVVDISDPTAPYIVANLALGGEAKDIKLYGSRAYIADGSAGLQVVDISEPTSPQLITTYYTEGDYVDIGISAGLVAVAAGGSGIELISISDPDTPLHSGRIDGIGVVTSIDINVDEKLVVALANYEIHIVDISNSLTPIRRYSLSTLSANQLALDGRIIYLSADDLFGSPYQVVDVEESYFATFRTVSDIGFLSTNLALANNLVFFADTVFFNAVPYVNTSDPDNVFYQGVVDLNSLALDRTGRAVAADSRYVYRLTENDSLYIGQYIDIKDSAGVAPEVNLTGLVENSIFAEGSTHVFNIQASDDIRVDMVELRIDNITVGSASSYPYSIPVTLPQQVGTFEVTAVAVDYAVNMGVSNSINIDIRSDIDQDLLRDELEAGYGTDLNDADSDDDLLEDGREIELGTDPLNPDTDGDGVTDWEEALAGTDPNSSAEDWVDETVLLLSDVSVSEATMQNAQIISDFDINVTDDLTVTGDDSSIAAANLTVGGTLTIDGTNFVVDTENISVGALQLINGAVLTVADSTDSGFRPLLIDASSEIFIDTTSSINMSGRGFMGDHFWPENYDNSEYYKIFSPYGCHGGSRSELAGTATSCSYGRYANASFAGSGGLYSSSSAAGEGGGYVRLRAPKLILDGAILADGLIGSRSGAGGGIRIEVDIIEGFGSLSTNGGNSRSSRDGAASGGRISLRAMDSNGWTGQSSSSGGLPSSSSYASGGAGTVYEELGGSLLGSLTISNDVIGENLVENLSTTIVEHVGRREIFGVTDLGSNRWEVETLSNPADFHSSGTVTGSGAGSVDYYYFELLEDLPIKITFSPDEYTTGGSIVRDFVLFHDDGALDATDFITRQLTTESNQGLKNSDFELAAGTYVLAIGGFGLSTDEAVSGVNSGQSGEYELWLETGDWTATNTAYEYGLQGLKVDLDASDSTGPIYTIESNTSHSFVIETTDDLSGIVGQELIGVHQFDQLTIKDGALVDFGGDRIEAVNLEVSEAVLRNFETTESALRDLLVTNVDGIIQLGSLSVDDLIITAPGIEFETLNVTNTLDVSGELTVNDLTTGNLAVSSGNINVRTLSSGTLTASVSSIEAANVHIAGNMELLAGTILTAPDSTEEGYTPLMLDIVGELYIDATSSISVDGKGFDGGNYGPDNSSNADFQSCHGGSGASSLDVERNCSYGRYSRATFAGSGGHTIAEGGGYVKIVADQFWLDGTVSANGISSVPSGAGGGVDIEVTTLRGGGVLLATGADGSGTYSSAGGRISIRAEISSWLGSINTQAGRGASSSYRQPSPGTIYIEDSTDTFGRLIVSNELAGQAQAQAQADNLGVTSIEHVGRHEIVSVTDLGGNRWEIETLVSPADFYSSGAITQRYAGSVAYHYFELLEDLPVTITLAPNGFDPDYSLFYDDGALDTSDLIADQYSTTRDEIISSARELAAGTYVLAIGDYSLTAEEAVNGSNSGTSGQYELWLETGDWTATNTAYEYGLQGLKVDLDASDSTGPIYTIESNTGHSFVVETLDDLSGVTGQELIGVHQFERLNIQNGASVDFGGDRVEVLDILNSGVIDAEILNIDPLSNFP